MRDNGGHAVALWNSMRMIYGVEAGDVFWAASDVGWVVGHSYIVYAPLLRGCTSVMYEGKPVGTPDAGAFWRVCAQHEVKVLFTAPTAMRAIKQQDPDGKLAGKYDLSKLEALFLAGERCDPPTAVWARGTAGQAGGRSLVADRDRLGDHRRLPPVRPVPVQARLGRPALPGLRPARAGRGWAALVAAGETGNLCARLPLPPGCAPTLWQNDEGYRTAYLSDFPGWYRTGDAGMIDEDGDVWVMGRTDDIINVAGHRLSTGQMEEVLASHPARGGMRRDRRQGRTEGPDADRPRRAEGRRRTAPESEIAAELVALVRERIGPVAAFKDARVVPRLPKTRSGKILRASIRKIADGETGAGAADHRGSGCARGDCQGAADLTAARELASAAAQQHQPECQCGAGREGRDHRGDEPGLAHRGDQPEAKGDRNDGAGNLRRIAAPQ